MIEDINRRNSIEKLNKNAKKERIDLTNLLSENPNLVFRVSTDLRILYANEPAKSVLKESGIKDKKILKKLVDFAIVSMKKNNGSPITLDLKTATSIYEFSIVKVENADYYNIYGKDITVRKKLEKSKRKIEKEKVLIIERNYMARELHDTVTQTLFASNLIAEVIPKIWKKDPESVISKLNEIRLLNNLAIIEIRALLFDLRPSSFKDEDLGEHLKELVKSVRIKTKIPISLKIDKKFRYPYRIEVNFFRIAKEALNNIIKHPSASKAKLVLKRLASTITLDIDDDGVGFNTKNTSSKNLGLAIMKERAKMIGASFKVKSNPGKGTKISVKYYNTNNTDNNDE